MRDGIFNKHVWKVPLVSPTGATTIPYEVRAGYDPDKISLDEIARIGEIEASRRDGKEYRRAGDAELVA